MKCPYCSIEMEHGYIKSSHFIHWGKEEKLGFLKKDIKLTRNSLDRFVHGHFVESDRCPKCGRIIVSPE